MRWKPRNGSTPSTPSSTFPARIAPQHLLSKLGQKAERSGVEVPFAANTPYINTISAEQQPPFPGNRDLERSIKSLVRWNAMAMVVQANETDEHHRRAHRHLRLVRHPLRDRLQPLLPAAPTHPAAAT